MKKTDFFVLDANILINAFLQSTNSAATQAYYKAKDIGQIVYSEDTFNEFSDVFVRPKFDRYVQLEKRLMIIESLRAIAKIIPVKNSINACRDPKDDKYLELAIEVTAASIVTADKDLLVLHPFKHIPILTAADFLREF